MRPPFIARLYAVPGKLIGKLNMPEVMRTKGSDSFLTSFWPSMLNNNLQASAKRLRFSGLRISWLKPRLRSEIFRMVFWALVGHSSGFVTDWGHHVVRRVFSLENRNLFPAAPQNTAIFSPSIDVLKTSDEYFFILSDMYFSGPDTTMSMFSPTTGQPVDPGGTFGFEAHCGFSLLLRLFIEASLVVGWGIYVMQNYTPEQQELIVYDQPKGLDPSTGISVVSYHGYALLPLLASKISSIDIAGFDFCRTGGEVSALFADASRSAWIFFTKVLKSWKLSSCMRSSDNRSATLKEGLVINTEGKVLGVSSPGLVGVKDVGVFVPDGEHPRREGNVNIVPDVASALVERHDGLDFETTFLHNLEEFYVSRPIILLRPLGFNDPPPDIHHDPITTCVFQLL
nr:Os07g0543300 [Ipomoea trifida]